MWFPDVVAQMCFPNKFIWIPLTNSVLLSIKKIFILNCDLNKNCICAVFKLIFKCFIRGIKVYFMFSGLCPSLPVYMIFPYTQHFKVVRQ